MSPALIAQMTMPQQSTGVVGPHRRAPLARRLRVSATRRAIPKARAAAAKVLADWGLAELIFDACLVLDELLANVVVHCPATRTATVALVYDATGLRIAVSDVSHVEPRV
ncbi:MAG: hypothetical protein L0Y54_04530, partial [Sporichthyaceae bacterium]|nr:hypothetical protein [Sporichthyaceae bacterium]